MLSSNRNGAPGVLGIWGEGLFIFRELVSTANYFRGAGEQAHTFVDLLPKSKKKYKASILSDSLKCRWLLGAAAPRPPYINVISFQFHYISFQKNKYEAFFLKN